MDHYLTNTRLAGKLYIEFKLSTLMRESIERHDLDAVTLNLIFLYNMNIHKILSYSIHIKNKFTHLCAHIKKINIDMPYFYNHIMIICITYIISSFIGV